VVTKEEFKPSRLSLDLLAQISAKIDDQTFHWHSHLLYDLPIRPGGFYVEVGCYAGATSSLMISKPDINVVAIDLGRPISEEIARENVAKFNQSGNAFWYLRGDSKSYETRKLLTAITKEIDILYIDGDHSFDAVITDFLNYATWVIPGGFVIFDDYHDDKYSPEVRPAVDLIVSKLLNNASTGNWEIWGTFKNRHRARPALMRNGNCFIIRKLP